MLELADRHASGACVGNDVRVRVSPVALCDIITTMVLGHDTLRPAPTEIVFSSPCEGFNHALKELQTGNRERLDLVTINTDFFNGRRDMFSLLKKISEPEKANRGFSDRQVWEGLQIFLSELSGETDALAVLHKVIKEEVPTRKNLNYYQDELTWSLPSLTDGVDWGISIVVEGARELSRSYFIAKTPEPKRPLMKVVSGFFKSKLGNPVDF